VRQHKLRATFGGTFHKPGAENVFKRRDQSTFTIAFASQRPALWTRRRAIDPIRPINAGDSRGFLVAAADMSRPKNFRPKILTIGTASLIFSSSETKGDRRTT
jgi:hypothetical protein